MKLAKIQALFDEAQKRDKECLNLMCPNEFRANLQAWVSLSLACLEYIRNPPAEPPYTSPAATTDFMQLIGKPWWWVIHTDTCGEPKAHLIREGEKTAVCGYLMGDKPFRLVRGFKGSGDEYCPQCEQHLPSIQNRG